MEVQKIIEVLESSAYWSHLGIKVREVEPGYARLSLPFIQELSQINRFMHGGAIASLVDAAGAVALIGELDLTKENMATAEIKLNYLNPVTMDQEEVVAHAKLLKRGLALGVSQVEVKNASGKLVAFGIGTYSIFARQ